MTTSIDVTPSPRTLRKVVAAGFIGTTVEYYDFFVYGTAAALVFPKIFFRPEDPTTATLASLATFGVAYIARPVGSFLMGHIGDRVGRKTVMVGTLLLMGVSTFLIGCLRPKRHRHLGADSACPAPRPPRPFRVRRTGRCELHVLRTRTQTNGAATTPAGPSAAPSAARSWPPLSSCPSPLTARRGLLRWGWRIPFLLSIVLVAVGMYVRLGISETPVFQAAAKRAAAKEKEKLPLSELFRNQTKEVLLAAGAVAMWLSFFYIGAVYITNYGTTVLGFSRNAMLTVNLVGVGFNVAGSILGAVLADRVGRRITIGTANALAVAWAFALFPLANSGNILLMGVAVSTTMVLVGIACGTTTAIVPEILRHRYRSTGTGSPSTSDPSSAVRSRRSWRPRSSPPPAASACP